MVLAAGLDLGVRLGEGRGRELNIGAGDLERSRRAPPLPRFVYHFGDDGSAAIFRFHIPLGRRDDGRKAGAIIGLVDIEDVVGSIRIGIQIKRWRQPPASRCQDKPMVPQVIVAVADGDIEGDSPEELLEIGPNMVLGTMCLQEFRELEVTRAFALILAQERHR